MATQVVAFNPSAAVPAFAKGRELSALTKALAGGGAQTGKRISLRGGVFRLISDGKEVAAIEERYLDVVIVAAAPKVSRTFYLTAFDPEKATAPSCFSQEGTVPDPTCYAPQSAQCASCPQNEKGSGQGETKACSYNQRLAIVLANDMEGDVMQLQLASNSIFGKEESGNYPLQAYARWLAAQPTPVEGNMVITRLKFDTTVSFPKLYFKSMRWLDDEEYAIAVKQGETLDAQNAVKMQVSQVNEVQPAPAAATKKAAAATPAAPAEDDEPPAPEPTKRKGKAAPAEDDEPPAPEPTKRKAAAKEASEVPSKGKLADVLSKWDDE